ncbi:beta-ketoacyl-[acyl-carrier-protein] synthase family protein [Streptomyces sp. NPDC018019]|uniref:beta-ketoacyl-[acyl-carrier-protein] synthase family protein n=1 Tax=Streptomyces sp. NPDC018019 TaxID=3365030 RepID=UPI00379BE6CC
MGRRVVITGVGPVSSIGVGVHAFTDALRQGRSGTAELADTGFAGFPTRYAGAVTGFDPSTVVERLAPGQWGRASLFGAAAARLAVRDADLDPARLPRHRAGVCMGTTGGESHLVDRGTARWIAEGLDHLDPDLARRLPTSRIADAVVRELAWGGETMTFTSACAAGNYALGHAYDAVVHGDADYMIAGGADSLSRWGYAGFHRLGAMAARVCAPFDRDRDGMLLAEGGAAVLLEPLESARSRRARIYAEVLGYGLSCDATHMIAPDADGMATAMRRAHRNAGVAADEIDYICAHGTGTPANDAAEWRAVLDVFGAGPPPTSSVKSMLGHTLGAASAFGVLACAVGLAEGFLPPTAHHRHPDPALHHLDPVPGRGRPARLRRVQNNGFAFGGNNAVAVLGRAER